MCYRKPDIHYVAATSGVAGSLVLAGQSCDISGMNIVLLAGHVPGHAGPAFAGSYTLYNAACV